MTDHAARTGRLLLPLAVAASLAACVGGDDPQPPAALAPATSVVVRLDPDTLRQHLSAYRAEHRLSPVVLDPALTALAQAQANAMAQADHLSHELAGSLDHRLNAAHHAKGYAVENVSAGYATADAALAGWQRSAGRNANLLDAHMRRMGIAVASAPGTRFKNYWALMMTD